MKKRILASTMASVMALSAAGTTLVSSAAVADYKNEYVTKAELKKFLEEKEIVDLAENGGVEEYGSISGANFMKAYDFAQNVVGNTNYNDDDATVAFQILKATKNALKQYNKAQLAALVEECRPTYDSENLLNDNNDAIYDETSWNKFVDAFESADSFTDSDDIRVTTDAYEELDAVKKPTAKKTKTKKEIDAARAAYEKALTREFDFQPWQRGTVNGSTVSNFNGVSFAWGTLFSYIKSGDSTLRTSYQKFDEIKGLTVTSDDDIVAAVNALNNAASVLNSFKATSFEAGSSTKTNSLLKKYHGQLVYTFIDTTTEITPIITEFITEAKYTSGSKNNNIDIMIDGKWEQVSAAPADPWNVTKSGDKAYKPMNTTTGTVDKVLSAEVRLRGDKELYCIVTKNKLPSGQGEIVVGSDSGYFYANEAAAKDNMTDAANQTTYKIAKGNQFVLSDLIAVDASDMSGADVESATTALNTATTALASAKDDVYKAATPNTGALVDLMTSINSMATIINGMKTAVTGLSDSTDDAITALSSAIGAYETKINAVKAAVSTASNTNFTEAQLTAVTTALGTNAIDTLIAAVSTAVDALDSGEKSSFDVSTLYGNSELDPSTEINAYVAAASAKAAAQTALNKAQASESYAKYNNFVDGTESGGRSIAGAFSWGAAYDSSLASSTCEQTTVSISQAMTLIEQYNAETYTNIDTLDGINTITGDPKGSTAEWKLIYNFTKYALEDLFSSVTDTLYGYRDVQTMLDNSYQLATDTVETSLFTASHMALYDARNHASDWLTQRKVTKPYTDKETVVMDGNDSTDEYKALKAKYDALKAEYDNFKYSYEDIVKKMAEIAKAIDGGVTGLNADLEAVAEAFIKVEAVKKSDETELSDSEAFTDDGELKKNNRLITKDSSFNLLQTDGTNFAVDASKGGKNQTHYDMRVAYDKLLDDYKKATATPEVKVDNDVDGSGKFDLVDVSALLKLYVDNKMEVAKHDFNSDGKVDLLDLTALLKKYVNS